MIKQWDAFISHASEDKVDFVLPLAEKLRSLGLKIWLDRFEIKVGDSLRGKIEEGLSRSRFGIVVLSPAFFAKHWTKKELDGLAALEEEGHKVILPIWRNLRKSEVTNHAPMLAGLYALQSIDGVDEVAKQLAAVILEPGSGSPSASSSSLARRLANLVESNAGCEEMWNFFLQHNAVVKISSSRIPYPEVLAIRATDKPYMGFACWRDDEPDLGITLVIPGPSFPPLFDEKQEPMPEMQGCIDSIIGLTNCISAGMAKTHDGRVLKADKISSRVIAGRRAFLSLDDMLGRQALKEYDVALRTYDQLIDKLAAIPGVMLS
ncbi:toll/interleukin-1 receptor domain-containing protein [Schlesneria sp. DSM 10557]|uniref:toll/interleukin-1 receptor domain-containing protein n=1 Tax=Schlesneria sp. DSM 10557 TaxID=3044399 RepID=UPI00359F5470